MARQNSQKQQSTAKYAKRHPEIWQGLPSVHSRIDQGHPLKNMRRASSSKTCIRKIVVQCIDLHVPLPVLHR